MPIEFVVVVYPSLNARSLVKAYFEPCMVFMLSSALEVAACREMGVRIEDESECVLNAVALVLVLTVLEVVCLRPD